MYMAVLSLSPPPVGTPEVTRGNSGSQRHSRFEPFFLPAPHHTTALTAAANWKDANLRLRL